MLHVKSYTLNATKKYKKRSLKTKDTKIKELLLCSGINFLYKYSFKKIIHKFYECFKLDIWLLSTFLYFYFNYKGETEILQMSRKQIKPTLQSMNYHPFLITCQDDRLANEMRQCTLLVNVALTKEVRIFFLL